MTTRRAARAALWGAVALWAGVIFWFSSLPGSQVPGKYGPLGHFGEYAIFGSLILLAIGDPGLAVRAAAFASAYGVTDELHQLFVSGRHADPVDWLVDTAGALAGALILGGLWKRFRARRDDGRP